MTERTTLEHDRPLLLVVEDEKPIGRFLRVSLLNKGYRVNEAATGAQALSMAAAEPPDMVILDLGLPDLDGLTVIDGLRAWTAAPVIVLSARGQERDKVTALDRGADDYLTKPFGMGELLARIRVAFRNQARLAAGGDTKATFQVGALRVDLASRRVFRDEEEVHLTPIEYRLLTTMVRYAGKVLTHRQILKDVWGPRHSDDPRYVRVFVANLRRKVESDPSRPRYLLTEQGVGYRLVDE